MRNRKNKSLAPVMLGAYCTQRSSESRSNVLGTDLTLVECSDTELRTRVDGCKVLLEKRMTHL